MRKPFPLRLLIGTAIRLLLICLAVGVLMDWLGIRPAHLITDLVAAFSRAWQLVAALIRWAASYIFLGAWLVVPVALVVLLLRLVRR